MAMPLLPDSLVVSMRWAVQYGGCILPATLSKRCRWVTNERLKNHTKKAWKIPPLFNGIDMIKVCAPDGQAIATRLTWGVNEKGCAIWGLYFTCNSGKRMQVSRQWKVEKFRQGRNGKSPPYLMVLKWKICAPDGHAIATRLICGVNERAVQYGVRILPTTATKGCRQVANER